MNRSGAHLQAPTNLRQPQIDRDPRHRSASIRHHVHLVSPVGQSPAQAKTAKKSPRRRPQARICLWIRQTRIFLTRFRPARSEHRLDQCKQSRLTISCRAAFLQSWVVPSANLLEVLCLYLSPDIERNFSASVFLPRQRNPLLPFSASEQN